MSSNDFLNELNQESPASKRGSESHIYDAVGNRSIAEPSLIAPVEQNYTYSLASRYSEKDSHYSEIGKSFKQRITVKALAGLLAILLIITLVIMIAMIVLYVRERDRSQSCQLSMANYSTAVPATSSNLESSRTSQTVCIKEDCPTTNCPSTSFTPTTTTPTTDTSESTNHYASTTSYLPETKSTIPYPTTTKGPGEQGSDKDFQLIKEAVKYATSSEILNVSQSQNRVGWVGFSSETYTAADQTQLFNQAISNQQTHDAIDLISFHPGGSNALSALNYARDVTFNSSNGNRPIDQTHKDLLILISDGNYKTWDKPIPAYATAMQLMAEGVLNYAVAVANN